MTDERMISPEVKPDDRLDLALRPTHLKEIIGQDIMCSRFNDIND